ncbi:MAG: hypothetical protein AB1791_03150 [Chloroflexota bacterium]
MAKGSIELTDEQRLKNALILARIEEERRRLYEETRALQQQWKSKVSRKRRRSRPCQEILATE